MKPMKKRTKLRRTALISGLVVVIAVFAGAVVLLLDRHAQAPQSKAVVASTSPKPTATAPTTPAPFDKTKYSTSDPSSLWVVVNKQHPFNPIDYTPSDLVTDMGHQVSSRMVDDLNAMVAAAKTDDAFLTIASSYRSYPYQIQLFNSYVATDGQEKADTYSARPGYSEHQTGLAIDFGDTANKCIVEDCYADTTEGKWLAANAYKYGFLLRYTADKQPVTGYEAEAWHYRYVGRDLTNEMHAEGITTLEEFFGITGGESYDTPAVAPSN